ncbi:MAG: hypothetical protein CVU29_03520 [Betaproteobacteria bacterium HGW-Betaproteobacteria-22]|nr:MAG: hypothetical protein CVU29_03520 [Betaproteobacteria bacterium HGW-Betaproteobacteria-22]
MQHCQKTNLNILHQFASLGFALILALPITAKADPLDLATIPLANSPTITIQPNLLFVLDDSGSMAQDYTPDYMSDIWNTPLTTDRQCRDSADDDGSVSAGLASGTSRVLDMCVVGDVPYMNSDMNSQYYNPDIRYRPALNADGTSKASQTDSTNVRTDVFNKHNQTQLRTSATSVDITSNYPDRVWCTKNNPTTAELTNTAVCRKNSDYLYPDATFKYGRTTGSPNTQVTTSMLNGVIKVFGGPYYYSVVPTEYCSDQTLKDCILTSVPVGVYTIPAKSRWCDSTALTNCKSTFGGNFVWPRYVGATNSAVAAVGSMRVNDASTGAATLNSLKVNGIEIMAGGGAGCGAVSVSLSGSGSTRRAALATAIASKINSCNSSPEYTASVGSESRPVITITSTAAAGATANGTLVVGTLANGVIDNISNLSGGASGSSFPPYTFVRTDITPSTTSYPKASGRSDCAATTCTYSEEMTNFANWYAYYRTRMQSMKTAVSIAFRDIGSDFRVGFMTINPSSSNALKFDTFASTHKSNWYGKVFGTSTPSGTPLRRALSRAGRIYAAKDNIGGAIPDPVEYSCQQNFTLLTTDGFWNGDGGLKVDGTTMTNQDGGATPRPFFEGPDASTNSLADVAKHYRDTDLRTSALGNCDGAIPSITVCQDPPPATTNQKQTMVTMTLGLGIDGQLAYRSDYKTATEGDYYDIRTGQPGANWPQPIAEQPSAVDDLWHAAVNGEGSYFSAKNPAELIQSLQEALASVKVKLGAATAAATSTLNPVSGDNFAYVASYTTSHWIGNLERRTIDVVTGEVSASASKCVEDVLPTSGCAAPASIIADGGGGYNCVTPGVTDPLACTGTLDGTDCKIPVSVSCSGTLKAKVSLASDTRTIKMNNGSGSLVDFSQPAIGIAGLGSTFDSAFLAANLTQWTTLNSAQQSNVTAVNLVNYLRGQKEFDGNAIDLDKRVFRKRQAVMGDAVDSKPAFIGKPTFSYTDPGYDTFKTDNVGRAKTVYMGANDGMLHAFDADTLEERWAYVPSMVIPNMWKLADTGYANKHSYYVNGDPIISDVCVSGCTGAGAVWKTILVAGLGGGGRGYFALDITNPASPALLWEVSPDDIANLGYTFGTPVITKRPDGKWVVLVTSGYNNIPDNSAFYALASTKFKPNNPALYNSGNGQGYLYVLDAVTGVKLQEIGTGAGSVSAPSGLGKIKAFSEDAEKNNLTKYVYGGDLLGNLWRFNIDDGTKIKIAQLEASSTAQPVTTAPELGFVNNKRVVFVGTGKYLEISDLTDTSQQTLYAIKDDDTGTTLVDPRSSLVEQTIVPDGADNRKSGTTNAVDFSTGLGWYIDLPDSGERQNVNARLVLGTLLVPTTVPTSSVCQPAGYGWFNFLDYKTGRSVDTTLNVSKRTNAPTVGFNVVYIDGKPKVSIVTADDPTPQLIPDIPFQGSGTGFQQRRSIWREIVN